jgi:hypothetical protein
MPYKVPSWLASDIHCHHYPQETAVWFKNMINLIRLHWPNSQQAGNKKTYSGTLFLYEA